MDNQADVRARCAAVLTELNRDQGWELDEAGLASYATGLTPHLLPACADELLRAKAEHYHLDHGLVQALRDREHPQHAAVWAQWVAQVLRIVRQRYRHAAGAAVADEYDIAQEALAAISQSLPRFQYASRFSTWAYSVVMRTAHRQARDQKAAKRAAELESLDRQAELGLAPPEASALETLVEARLLAELIDRLLREQPDHRLAEIFRLWAIQDQRLANIGRAVQLSPSRVNALLAQSRRLLQQHPALLAWLADRAVSEPLDDAGGVGQRPRVR